MRTEDLQVFFVQTFSSMLLLSTAYACTVLDHNSKLPKVSHLSRVSKVSKQPWVELGSLVTNIAMCGFSAIGSWYAWDAFVQIISGEYVEPNRLFFLAYGLSKPLEFLDTYFLMLKGKKVGTLHWTHHVLTMLYVWYIAMNSGRLPSNFYLMFCILNYFVHSVMYGYYVAMHFTRLPSWVGVLVTSCQLTQFVLGVFWTLLWMDSIPADVWSVTMAMYIYYFVMFLRFFYKRYIWIYSCLQCSGSVQSFCKACHRLTCAMCQVENVCPLCAIVE